MSQPSDKQDEREQLRERIIGMGETSLHKSYYPLLQQRLLELERFRALLDDTHDMILMIQTPGNRCVDINRATCDQLGYTMAELLSMDIANLVAQEKRDAFREVFCRATNTREQEKIETTFQTSQEHEIPVEILIRFVTFSQQDYGVVIARNISERIRYERALVATQKKLNLINTLTRTDIKTQVFIVRAYLDVLNQLARHPEETTVINKLKETTREIQRHIEFAENYQNVGVKTPQWQNFNEVMLYAVSHLPPIFLTRGSSLDRFSVLCDPLLEKGLTHLMEYIYAKGKITEPIEVSHEESVNGLVIRLKKAGQGIPPEKKEDIFACDPTKTSGPNLFFVREILDMTGISIHETGDMDTTCFEIRIPKEGYRVS
ncbi:MAG: PAS domain S-box protein [Methanoregula sp.]|nr:PAS domain S-box protein [Methanoregula sp.]